VTRRSVLEPVNLVVDLKQKTIGEIIESERMLVLEAPDRYGAYYTNALDTSIFLTTFIKSLDPDRFVFGRYYSQVKKHHLLALFSTVRLHQVQATMNLRQVLEAGSLAAFAIDNPDPSLFVTEDKNGLLNSSQKLTGNAYKWLDQNYPQGSKSLKEMKDNINASTAHANLVYTGANFEVADDGVSSPFFDFEDSYAVKTELWRIGNIAISLLDLFCGVNQSVGSIKFVDDFPDRFSALVEQSKSLHAEMTSTDRYKAAAMKAEARFAGNIENISDT
jgi:hypothetical protein